MPGTNKSLEKNPEQCSMSLNLSKSNAHSPMQSQLILDSQSVMVLGQSIQWHNTFFLEIIRGWCLPLFLSTLNSSSAFQQHSQEKVFTPADNSKISDTLKMCKFQLLEISAYSKSQKISYFQSCFQLQLLSHLSALTRALYLLRHYCSCKKHKIYTNTQKDKYIL